MAKYKGYAVIYGAPGTVKCAGAATGFANSTTGASVSDASDIQTFKDAYGVERTKVRPQLTVQSEFNIRPGSGDGTLSPSSLKALEGLATLIMKGDAIVTSGFEVATLNFGSSDKAVVEDCSVSVDSEGAATLRVTARKIVAGTGAGAVVDFTSAWADA